MTIGPTIAPETLRAFATALRKKLRKGDRTFGRDQVRAIAQRIEVVSRKEVRIPEQRSELLRTVTAASGVEAAVLGVRAFEPKWHMSQDSSFWAGRGYHDDIAICGGHDPLNTYFDRRRLGPGALESVPADEAEHPEGQQEPDGGREHFERRDLAAPLLLLLPGRATLIGSER